VLYYIYSLLGNFSNLLVTVSICFSAYANMTDTLWITLLQLTFVESYCFDIKQKAIVSQKAILSLIRVITKPVGRF